MSRAALSMLVFGIYLALLAVALLIAPNAVIGAFGLPPTSEVWIRVAAFLAGAIGYYYVRAALAEVRPFFHWTVHARLTVPLFFGAFVAFGLARPALMLLAAVDLVAALWTAWALRADAKEAA